MKYLIIILLFMSCKQKQIVDGDKSDITVTSSHSNISDQIPSDVENGYPYAVYGKDSTMYLVWTTDTGKTWTAKIISHK